MVRNWQMLLADTLTLSVALIYPTKETFAQNITTDGTLGTPQTLTGPNYNIPQSLGQTVNSNLFHSFGKFNLNSNEAAIFQSGNDINNIFSRVTGGSPSSIDGLIRTLGQDVNLFFLNPNGIIFGENASLDVSGSFLASTADSFVFGDGLEFSATNPQAAPLLTVNITPGLQYGQNNPAVTIENQGNLTAGQNLELLAGNLDLQGQLQAGQDLTLKADTLKIRDSLTNPFIAAAGNQLLIQGNESVDIFALNHPHSGLLSGGDMILSSANPVVGDIHFWSGGDFEINRLDSSKGDLFSLYDPIIRASGDVSFDSYTGASLHIFAGGSVTISGDINITSADTVGNSIQERVTLSDGETVVDIDGNTEPTLDIRAGTTAFGQPGITGTIDGLSNIPDTEGDGTSADISIGGAISVFDFTDGGKVFLTNQYQPNLSLETSNDITVGSIDTTDDFGGGSVTLDSRGGIIVNSQVDVSAFSESFNFLGNGGDVTLIANGDIIFNFGANIFSFGLLGGDISLKSESAISLKNSQLQSASFTNTTANSTRTGGEINLRAKSLFLSGSQLAALTLGTANAGNVIIQTTESVSLEGVNNNGIPSVIATQVFPIPEAVGNAGNLIIETEQLKVANGGQINSSTFSFGNAGELKIVATEVEVIGRTPDGVTPSSISGGTGNAFIPASGNGAETTIETERLLITNGAQVISSTFGSGDVGDLIIKAKEIEVVGSGISPNGEISSRLIAQVEAGASGGKGNLNIESERIFVADGGQIGVTTLGDGDAGNLTIVSDSVELIGESMDGVVPSGLFAQVNPNAMGSGGDLTVQTKSLKVIDGAEVSVSTFGIGDAGNLNVIANSIELRGTNAEGSPSGLFAQVNSNATGSGGNLNINTGTLKVIDGAVVSASTFGIGDAGNIIVTANSLETNNGGQIITNTSGDNSAGNITLEIIDSVTLTGSDSGIFANTQEGSSGNGGSILTQNQTPQTVLIKDGATIAVNSEGSGQGGSIILTAEELTLNNGSITAETASNKGGNITLDIEDTLSFENSGKITATAGTAQGPGNAGNVTIDADFILAFPTDNTYEIIAKASEGNGGNIAITTNGFFGREFVDISASSEEGLEGVVSIDILDIDPARGLTELPANIVGASQQITQGCTPKDKQESSRFIATGRGGLPLSPNEPLRGKAVITNWVDEPTEIITRVNNQSPTKLVNESSAEIVEAQGWMINDRGNIELVAESPAQFSTATSVACNK